MGDRGEQFVFGDDGCDGMSDGEVAQVVGMEMVAERK